MMFFIPPAILAIEDEDDRSFMENLYRSYYRLMYHEIFTVTSDPWLAEDILQNVVISLIRNLSNYFFIFCCYTAKSRCIFQLNSVL